MGMADSGLTAEQYQEAWRERTERMERDEQRSSRANGGGGPMAGRYVCGTCGSDEEQVRINGTVGKHNTLVVSRGGIIRRSEQVCTGSGEPAELVEDGELAAAPAAAGA